MQNTTQTVRVADDASAWQVGITRETIQRILAVKSKGSDSGDMLALWMFYAYTARWQNVNQPRATTGYTASGLGWSESRVRRAKHALKLLGLIEDISCREENNRITGWYVKVFHLTKANIFHPHDFAQCGQPGDKCSRSSTLNALGNKSKETKETSPQADDAHFLQKKNTEPVNGKQSEPQKPSLALKPSPNIPAVWKPDRRSKIQQLAALPAPSENNYPSQVEFDDFLEDNALGQIQNYRQDLYFDLCEHKWHQWKKEKNCWKPIHDWKAYVIATDAAIEAAPR